MSRVYPASLASTVYSSMQSASPFPSGPVAGLAPTFVITPQGDSIIAGNDSTQASYALPRQLAALLGQRFMAGPNLAIAGATLGTGSSAVIVNQYTTPQGGGFSAPSGEQDLIAGQPACVVTDGGSNDIAIYGQSASATATLMATYVTTMSSDLNARSSPLAKHAICVMTPTGRTDTPVDFTAYANLIRANYASWGATNVRVVLVDATADPIIGQGGSGGSVYFQPDNVHLTQAGVARLASLFVAAMTAAGVLTDAVNAAPALLVDGITPLPGQYFRCRPGYGGVANSQVLAWYDLSGNSNHIQRASTTWRPAWTSSKAAYNGKSTATFDGTRDVPFCKNFSYAFGPSVTDLSLTLPFTTYVVGNNTSASVIASLFGYSPTPYLWTDASASNFYQYLLAGGAVSTTIASSTTPYMFACEVTATGGTLWINDHTTPVGTFSAAQSAVTSLVVGALVDNSQISPSFCLTGDIASFLIMQGQQSAAVRNTIFQTDGVFFGASVS